MRRSRVEYLGRVFKKTTNVRSYLTPPKLRYLCGRHHKFIILPISLILMVYLWIYMCRTPIPTTAKPFVYTCQMDYGYPQNISFTDLNNMSAFPVISHHPFKYIYNASERCRQKSDVYLLVLVKSAVQNCNQRFHSRNTWGKTANERNVVVNFLLGYNQSLESFVKYEEILYGDIIQETFVDSYYNNTHKTTMALNWIQQFCSHAKFIFFVDDDVFVNVPKALKFLRKWQKTQPRDEYLYNGMVEWEPIPERNFDSKWLIFPKEYEFDCYPPYVGGAAIFMSRLVARYIQQAIPYVRFLPFDDVLLGIVAQKLGIRPTHNRDMDIKCNIDKIGCLITIHGLNATKFEEAHTKLLSE